MDVVLLMCGVCVVLKIHATCMHPFTHHSSISTRNIVNCSSSLDPELKAIVHLISFD